VLPQRKAKGIPTQATFLKILYSWGTVEKEYQPKAAVNGSRAKLHFAVLLSPSLTEPENNPIGKPMTNPGTQAGTITNIKLKPLFCLETN
jgi:hypothetical protein